MCIAITAKIISKDDSRAKAEYMGNIIDIELGLVNADPGDCVLIHAGCAIQKVSEEQAAENDLIFRELMEVWDDING